SPALVRQGPRRSKRHQSHNHQRRKREDTMRRTKTWLAAAGLALLVNPAFAQMTIVNPALVAKIGGIPQFEVDPFFPKHLPNNWLLGQVSGIRFDKNNNLWLTHRAGALTKRELAADNGQARCCSKTPPVLVFDQSGNVIKSWGGPGQGYNWPKSEH